MPTPWDHAQSRRVRDARLHDVRPNPERGHLHGDRARHRFQRDLRRRNRRVPLPRNSIPLAGQAQYPRVGGEHASFPKRLGPTQKAGTHRVDRPGYVLLVQKRIGGILRGRGESLNPVAPLGEQSVRGLAQLCLVDAQLVGETLPGGVVYISLRPDQL